MKINIAGGAKIGASATVFETQKIKLCIDWGGDLSRKRRKPLYDNVSEIQHTLLTHGHFDHVGNVLELVRGSNTTFHCSQPTFDFIVAGIEFTLRENNIYNSSDLEALIARTVTYRHGQKLDFGHGLKVETLSAGHILGASSYVIRDGGYSIFYTGDICLHNQTVTPKATLPNGPMNMLIREFTYGSQFEFEPFEQVIDKFVSYIKNKIEQRSKILIPVLSLGRFQEIATILYRAGIDFYADGAFEIRKIYAKHCKELEFLTRLKSFNGVREKHDLMGSDRGAVVLASSGMLMENTNSAMWANWIAPRQNGAIVMVNYQDPDGAGAQLQIVNPGNFLPINNRLTVLNCDVEKFQFPGHMSGRDGWEMEKKFIPNNDINSKVIIHHYPDFSDAIKYIRSQTDRRQRFVVKVGEIVNC